MKECCRKYLNEQFGDDPETLDAIYGEYVSSMSDKVAEAESALAASQWIQLDRAAHTMKGNAMSVGDNETAKAAIALRRASSLEDAELSAAIIAQIKELAKAL